MARIFVVKGTAGTGKSQHIVLKCNSTPNSIIVSFTNKAVKVISNRIPILEKTSGIKISIPDPITIHSAFYRVIPTENFKIKMEEQLDPNTGKVIVDSEGKIVFSQKRVRIVEYRFDPSKVQKFGLDLDQPMTIFIDEASMVPPELLYNLIEHTNFNLYFVGDPRQLPPVIPDINLVPAPQQKYVNWFINASPDLTLSTKYRFQNGSPIDMIADNILQKNTYPSDMSVGDNDLLILDLFRYKLKFTSQEVEELLSQHSDKNSIILAHRNISVSLINNIVRRSLHSGKNLLRYLPGDKLYVDSNYKTENVIKGTLLTVIDQTAYDKDTDVCILDVEDENQNQFQILSRPQLVFDSSSMTWAKFKPTRNDIELCKCVWGFCITAHKSQGSQWEKVMVCDDGAGFNNTVFRTQWLYTAVTRAEKQLVIVKGEIK